MSTIVEASSSSSSHEILLPTKTAQSLVDSSPNDNANDNGNNGVITTNKNTDTTTETQTTEYHALQRYCEEGLLAVLLPPPIVAGKKNMDMMSTKKASANTNDAAGTGSPADAARCGNGVSSQRSDKQRQGDDDDDEEEEAAHCHNDDEIFHNNNNNSNKRDGTAAAPKNRHEKQQRAVLTALEDCMLQMEHFLHSELNEPATSRLNVLRMYLHVIAQIPSQQQDQTSSPSTSSSYGTCDDEQSRFGFLSAPSNDGDVPPGDNADSTLSDDRLMRQQLTPEFVSDAVHRDLLVLQKEKLTLNLLLQRKISQLIVGDKLRDPTTAKEEMQQQEHKEQHQDGKMEEEEEEDALLFTDSLTCFPPPEALEIQKICWRLVEIPTFEQALSSLLSLAQSALALTHHCPGNTAADAGSQRCSDKSSSSLQPPCEQEQEQQQKQRQEEEMKEKDGGAWWLESITGNTGNHITPVWKFINDPSSSSPGSDEEETGTSMMEE